MGYIGIITHLLTIYPNFIQVDNSLMGLTFEFLVITFTYDVITNDS